MGPLSIAASAIAIIQGTIDLVTGLKSYYKNVKGSSEEIAQLLRELETFDAVLASLKDISHRADELTERQINQSPDDTMSFLENSRLPMLQKMLEDNAPLSRCYNDLRAFKAKHVRRDPGVWKSFKWPFEKDDIKDIVGRLRNYTSLLNTAINSDSL